VVELRVLLLAIVAISDLVESFCFISSLLVVAITRFFSAVVAVVDVSIEDVNLLAPSNF